MFEFACDKCGKRFEKFLFKASEAQNLCCPACGNGHIERQISAFGIGGSEGKDAASRNACAGAAST